MVRMSFGRLWPELPDRRSTLSESARSKRYSVSHEVAAGDLGSAVDVSWSIAEGGQQEREDVR